MAGRVFLPNLDFEFALALGSSYRPKAVARRRNAELSWAIAVEGQAEDHLLWEGPSRAPLRIPEGLPQPCAAPPPGAELVPWGIDHRALELAPQQPWPKADAIRRSNDKSQAQELAQQLGVALPGSQVLSSEEDLAPAIAVLGSAPWILKPAFSVAGRGCFKGRGSKDAEAHRGWLRRALRRGRVVLQPWLERRLDFAMIGELGDQGGVFLGLVETLIAGSTWRGTRVGGDLCLGRGQKAELRRVFESVAEALARWGYRGPFAVDGFLAQSGLLVPLLEINARRSMSRSALLLRERLAPGAPCLLVKAPRESIPSGSLSLPGGYQFITGAAALGNAGEDAANSD